MDTIAESYFPFDSGAGSSITEDQWRKIASLFAPTGPVAGELLQLNVYGDSSTPINVKVQSGKAFIRGHFYETDAQLTKTLATAHATLPRIDRVVVRADFVNNTIVVFVITGTAASSPAAPTITQSASIWDVLLAQVRVNAGVTFVTAGNVTDERNLVNVQSPVPPGVTAPYAGTSAPAGWLLCQGQAVSRVTYAALFNNIGTAHGPGDGSTTFNVPDYRGRVPVGLDSADTQFDAVGEGGGTKTHTLTVAEMPTHDHDPAWSPSLPRGTSGANSYQGGVDGFADNQNSNLDIQPTGGGNAHNNLQPFRVGHFIIKT